MTPTFTTRVVIEYVGGREVSRHLEPYTRTTERGDTKLHEGRQYTRTVVESCDGVEVGRYTETFHRFGGDTRASQPPETAADDREPRPDGSVVNLFGAE